MEATASSPARAWRWIPTLYFYQGVPNAVAASLAVVLLKNLGLSNAEIAFYTSALYLPWVFKPLWSPVVEMFGAKRQWVVALQFGLALSLAGIAAAIPGADFLHYTLVCLWLMAFASATHDIAADGFYLLALPPHQQAAFVGVRSTFFRLSVIAVKGGLVALAGFLLSVTGDTQRAWSLVFALLAGAFALGGAYHWLALPRIDSDRPADRSQKRARFAEVFSSFLAKPGIGTTVAFLLLYRLAESLALKLVEPFLIDARSVGGLGLSLEQVGLVNGTIGTCSLLAGGLLGGWLISRHGLKRLLWPMLVIMHVPIAVFALLAVFQPASLVAISAGLAVEQFGYGFGFTAYMVYMMMVAEGPHKTAHYAICTGFMAAGLLVPGMVAGWLQETLGYVNFFLWVCGATLPSFAVAAFLRIDPAFGRKVS